MINKFCSFIFENNLILVFLSGVVLGGSVALGIQHLRILNLQAQYENFIEEVKLQGEIQKRLVENQILEERQYKERSDHDYKTNIDLLHTDIKRLQNARASRSFLPATSAAATNPEPTCFNSAELERALQQLDDEVQGLITEGDEAELALNNAKIWAASIHY